MDRRRSIAVADDFWLPTATGALRASWFWPERAVDPCSTGVVIVPGLIHEEQNMAVGLVALATELADQGLPALLVDLAGTAQGHGDLTTPGVAERWAEEIRAAVAHVRESGLAHVAVVGVRVGALLAMDALRSDPVDLLVAWSPVMSGRRYLRELRLMQGTSTDMAGVADLPGITVAGFTLPPDVMNHLGALEVAKLDGKPAARLAIVDSPHRLEGIDPERPPFTEVPTERIEALDTEEWLFSPVDNSAAPFRDLPVVVETVRRLLREPVDLRLVPDLPASDLRAPDTSSMRSHEFHHDGVLVRETMVRFGPDRLWGIVSGPADADAAPAGPAYVAVTAVGPSRIFADFSRRQAARGRTTLRFEPTGFGTSPRRTRDAWADFYHHTVQHQIAEAVDLLVAAGHAEVDIVSFCAGAWSALQMKPHRAVRRIAAVNVQLSVRRRFVHRRPWPGQTRLQSALASVAQRPQMQRAVKKVDQVHPMPSPTLSWIRRHRRAGTDVALVFADEDRGLAYFRRRFERRLARDRDDRRPELIVIEGLGHLPTGTAREAMFDAMAGVVDAPTAVETSRLAVVYDGCSTSPMDLAAALADGFDPVWVIDGSDPTLGSLAKLLPRLGEVVDHAGRDVADVAAQLAELGVDGVIAFSDPQLRLAADLAEELGLPGNPPEVVERLNDKYAQRRALSDAGIPTPAFALIAEGTTGPEARTLAAPITFPAVFKPLHGDSSADVVGVADLAELETLVAHRAAGGAPGDFIVEDYLLDRPADPSDPAATAFAGYVSVEVMVVAGEPTPLAVTGKFPLAPPFRECGNFMPHALSDDEATAVVDLAVQACRGLGVRSGALHIEVKLTPDGPRIIEVNGRIAGGAIDHLFEAHRGVSLTRLAAAVATGQALSMAPTSPQRPDGPFIYQYFLQPPVEATSLVSISGTDALVARLGADSVSVNRSPGDQLDWRAGSQGYVLRVGGVAADRAALAAVPETVAETVAVAYELDARPN